MLVAPTLIDDSSDYFVYYLTLFGAVHPHTKFQKGIGKGVSHLRYR